MRRLLKKRKKEKKEKKEERKGVTHKNVFKGKRYSENGVEERKVEMNEEEKEEERK